MVRVWHVDLRVGPWALLFTDHKGDDPGQIGLERQNLQVHHQLQVVFEHRRRTFGLLDVGQLDIDLLLGLLDSPLDVADGLRVLLHLYLVLRPYLAAEGAYLVRHGVEYARLLSQPRLPSRPLGGATVAEQSLEHGTRIVLRR